MVKSYRVLFILLLTVGCGVGSGTVDGPRNPPPPPARAADPDRILQPRTPGCEVQCTEFGEAYEKCTAMICAGDVPRMLEIVSIDSPDKSPGDSVEMRGFFGRQEESQAVILAEEREGALYLRFRLKVLSWENDRIIVVSHDRVTAADYQLLIVYQMNLGAGARPVYMQNSNTVPIVFRSP